MLKLVVEHTKTGQTGVLVGWVPIVDEVHAIVLRNGKFVEWPKNKIREYKK